MRVRIHMSRAARNGELIKGVEVRAEVTLDVPLEYIQQEARKSLTLAREEGAGCWSLLCPDAHHSAGEPFVSDVFPHEPADWNRLLADFASAHAAAQAMVALV